MKKEYILDLHKTNNIISKGYRITHFWIVVRRAVALCKVLVSLKDDPIQLEKGNREKRNSARLYKTLTSTRNQICIDKGL